MIRVHFNLIQFHAIRFSVSQISFQFPYLNSQNDFDSIPIQCIQMQNGQNNFKFNSDSNASKISYYNTKHHMQYIVMATIWCRKMFLNIRSISYIHETICNRQNVAVYRCLKTECSQYGGNQTKVEYVHGSWNMLRINARNPSQGWEPMIRNSLVLPML